MTPTDIDAGETLAEQTAARARCAHSAGGFEPFPAAARSQSIPARFEREVARHPERLAVKSPGVALSYEELNVSANRMAYALLAGRGERAEPVALLFGNGAGFIAASLAALKAGKIQVPLDRDFPRDRLAYMLEHSQARTLLTDAEHLALARELAGPGCEIIDVDRVDRQCSDNPGLAIAPEAWASINYTSGSTGAPKGIVHDHRSILCQVMRHANAFRLGPEDRQAFIHPALAPPLYALLAGATACPVDLEAHGLAGLADWLIGEKVTVYRSAVSGFRLLLDGLRGDEGFPDLRLVLVFGEPAYPADVARHRRHFGEGCLFVGSLGAKETGDYAYFFADRATRLPAGAVPGGYAAEDVDVILLDEHGRPVPAGEPGELAVRTQSAPVGYWNSPELTQAALLPDPDGGDGRVYRTGDLGRRLPDGCLLHLGRRDFQVKIRGYRVDVGEVEHALLAVPGVKQAVVAGREDAKGGRRLVAYLVPEGPALPAVSELRRRLGAELAPYMVPTAFVTLGELPRTATGKIDRRALPPPDRARPDLGTEPVPPRGPLEAMLMGIWADVLGLDEVGVHDAFLDLGGDSLRANQVVSRVLEQVQVPLSPHALFMAPTIADMAAAILCAGVDDAAGGALKQALDDLETRAEP